MVERLHQVLDGRNAAAVFNAAAMAAGGGRGTGSLFSGEGVGLEAGETSNGTGSGLRLDEQTLGALNGGQALPPPSRAPAARTQQGNTNHSHGDTTSASDDGASGSEASASASMGSSVTDGSTSESDLSRKGGEVDESGDGEVWAGGMSCVVGLQKRGLRGLMEGRRMRERGRGGVNGDGAGG